jgi:putative spermidine/putrescine transport system ATP-binding protein
MVFQSYALFPHMSALDNVAYPLRMRGIGKAERRERALEALRAVLLEAAAARRPRQLSGGQQQRVALARALVFDPQLLLMDEPLGALDRKLREHMQLEIRRLHRERGVTVIYVTHDQDEALSLSDRIAVMRDGRIEQVGAPYDVYAHPRSLFVADFVGEATILAGELAGVHGEYADVTLASGERVRARRRRARSGGAGRRRCPSGEAARRRRRRRARADHRPQLPRQRVAPGGPHGRGRDSRRARTGRGTRRPRPRRRHGGRRVVA